MKKDHAEQISNLHYILSDTQTIILNIQNHIQTLYRAKKDFEQRITMLEKRLFPHKKSESEHQLDGMRNQVDEIQGIVDGFLGRPPRAAKRPEYFKIIHNYPGQDNKTNNAIL